ncbi:capsid completion protein [Escherichia coli]|nr:capsid completion protein [Escherichia coli]
MSGEGTVVIPQPAGDEPVIKNTFFFPDIDPKRVRERMRLEQTVAPARLREAIKSGMAETNAELYEYREQKIAAGFTRLADVPADDIDGESIKVFYYERAVCAMATASLYERYRGVDASARATRRPTALTAPLMNCGGICAGRWHVSRTSALHRESNLMKTFALQGDTLDAICVRYYGRTEGVVETVLAANRDWLNWVRCCRTAPPSNCPTFRPRRG